ncbi:PREDICTED: BTB/POZ [Prunus dulcis]|uniref:PREDICTED: BTB/POZ n=1 Tax=Prunus dulcis TaxID=3755 RepID=A0A5E4EJD2_PRUDU|nr:BTB/POZ domain-containing protein At3g19850-like [Prunus dulcis]VVA14721.1 PREDICTED: BTB/POZ [Prunus dulcis]
MSQLSDFQIHINGQQTFFVNEEILSTYSGRLKKIIKQERRRNQIKNSGIEIDDFPGGPDGFELISRFCYNNGRITTTVSNVSLLHCCAVYLGMTEKLSTCNLLQQTQVFLDGLFEWSWKDILVCLKSCGSFCNYADSSGLLDKLICALLAKIAQNSDISSFIAASSSTSSSPETASGFRPSSSYKNTPESIKPSSSSRAWWFDDVAILPPKIIEKLFQSLGAYGADNNSLILTRFLLHYLKVSAQRKANYNHTSSAAVNSKCEFGGLADTAVHGIIFVGRKTFSCRALFWVLRIVSGFGLSKEYRLGLERLIGGMLDEATLDDLLVSGHDRGVYDVNLVIRLIRVFVKSEGVSVQKLKIAGRLIDKYLGEISPDQNLKISKFLGVAESLPDSARDCFDGAYRAIDIYLESHPSLSFEERSRLCRCLNYEKLSLGACKELAKNPKIPPRVAMQALMSQQSKITPPTPRPKQQCVNYEMIVYKGDADDEESLAEEGKMEETLNLQRMQWRVVELEKLCRQMKGQMSRMVKHNHVLATPTHARPLPRLC